MAADARRAAAPMTSPPARPAIDRLSRACALLAAWMFVAVGAMVTFEVAARYLFNAPTIWSEEMSRFFQIWAVYLGAAHVLRHGDLIRITVVRDRLPAPLARAADAFALIAIAVFSAIAVVYGIDIVADTVRLNRHSDSMLSLPLWWSEIAIPIGFALLFAQALAGLAALAKETSARRREGGGA